MNTKKNNSKYQSEDSYYSTSDASVVGETVSIHRGRFGMVEEVFYTQDPFSTHTVHRAWNHERGAFPSIATQKYFQESRYRAVNRELQYIIYYPDTKTRERLYVTEVRPNIHRNDLVFV